MNNKSTLSHAILDLPYLAEILEEMILPRYHIKSDEGAWSGEILDFLSCSLSGSVESLVNVHTLMQWFEFKNS